MDSRAPSGPRARFGCDGSWLMASLAKVSSMSVRFWLLKPSSTRRRTVSLFWSVVVMVLPFFFAVENATGFAEGLVRTSPACGSDGALGPERTSSLRGLGRASAAPVDGATCNELALFARHGRTPSRAVATRNRSRGACGAPRRHWGTHG